MTGDSQETTIGVIGAGNLFQANQAAAIIVQATGRESSFFADKLWLIGAIIWNLVTWLLGLPSSSSHALFGGLIGAALRRSPARGPAAGAPFAELAGTLVARGDLSVGGTLAIDSTLLTTVGRA